MSIKGRAVTFRSYRTHRVTENRIDKHKIIPVIYTDKGTLWWDGYTIEKVNEPQVPGLSGHALPAMKKAISRRIVCGFYGEYVKQTRISWVKYNSLRHDPLRKLKIEWPGPDEVEAHKVRIKMLRNTQRYA